MKREYDFSQGARGKFYRPAAQLNLPIYLEKEVLDYLSERAEAKGIGVDRLVNDILKREIDLIDAVK
jgi:hypothetical protein